MGCAGPWCLCPLICHLSRCHLLGLSFGPPRICLAFTEQRKFAEALGGKYHSLVRSEDVPSPGGPSCHGPKPKTRFQRAVGAPHLCLARRTLRALVKYEAVHQSTSGGVAGLGSCCPAAAILAFCSGGSKLIWTTRTSV